MKHNILPIAIVAMLMVAPVGFKAMAQDCNTSCQTTPVAEKVYNNAKAGTVKTYDKAKKDSKKAYKKAKKGVSKAYDKTKAGVTKGYDKTKKGVVKASNEVKDEFNKIF